MHTITIYKKYSDSVHFNNNSHAIFSCHTFMFSRQQFEHVLTKWFQEKCETMIKLTIPEVGYFAFPLGETVKLSLFSLNTSIDITK